MNKKFDALDDFIDDCFINEDPLCEIIDDNSYEDNSAQRISAMIAKGNHPKSCLISVMNEPKVA